jgi:hypothetical protein
MRPIIRFINPIPEISSIGIFKPVRNDADEILYPVIVDGNYFHLKQSVDIWNAVGLSDSLSFYIGSLIEQIGN